MADAKRFMLEDGRWAERRVVENVKDCEGEKVTELHAEEVRPLYLTERLVEKSKPFVYEKVHEVLDKPATNSGSVTFPYALEGGSDKYVVLLTTTNGGYVYVTDTDEDSDGNFTGFSFLTEVDCDTMYMVASIGVRPVITQA